MPSTGQGAPSPSLSSSPSFTRLFWALTFSASRAIQLRRSTASFPEGLQAASITGMTTGNKVMSLLQPYCLLDDIFIKVIDRHSSVYNDALSVNAAGAIAQEKYRCIGHFLGS